MQQSSRLYFIFLKFSQPATRVRQQLYPLGRFTTIITRAFRSYRYDIFLNPRGCRAGYTPRPRAFVSSPSAPPALAPWLHAASTSHLSARQTRNRRAHPEAPQTQLKSLPPKAPNSAPNRAAREVTRLLDALTAFANCRCSALLAPNLARRQIP